MNRNKGIQWLYEELDSLIGNSIVDETTANRIREYYGPSEVKSRADLAIIIFSVIGATLIGLGIILVLASNWDALNRPLRAVISITPLVCGQFLCGWVILRKYESLALREGASTFLMLAVAASISLIGQTYHIPGNLGSFLLTWQLLTLPLIYLMSAAVPTITYIAMITAWAGYAQSEGGHAALFYVFAVGVAPFIWMNVRKDPGSPRARLLLWVTALSPCIATGIVLEKAVPGIWLLVYTAYFAMLYLMDAIMLTHDGSPGRRPFLTVGRGGILILSLIFTFEWPWREIGWRYYRYEERFFEWAGILDYILLLLFLIPAIVFLVHGFKQKKYDLIPLGIAPIVMLISWSLASMEEDPFISVVIFNVYVLGLAISSIVSGTRQNKLSTVNVGLILIFLLIMFRFFDIDMSFVVRGIAFIILGIGFLTTNLVLNRRFKETA